MRPAEVGPAIVKAAENYIRELNRQMQEAPDAADTRKGATLAELASGACVARQTARDMVPKLLHRSRQLQVVGTRRVPYRNRPVNEYAPVKREPELELSGPAVLAGCLQGWAR